MRKKSRDDSKRADQARWGRLHREGKLTVNPNRFVKHPIWLTIILAGALAAWVGSYFILYVPTSSGAWSLVVVAGGLIAGCMSSIWVQDTLEGCEETSEDEETTPEG